MIISFYSELSNAITIRDGKNNEREYCGYLKPKSHQLLEKLLSLPNPAIGRAWQLLKGKVERVKR